MNQFITKGQFVFWSIKMNCLWEGCRHIWEAMPLIRTSMHNFGCHLSKGCYCVYGLLHFHHRWWFWTSLCHTHLYCIIVSQVYQWILTMIVPLGGERMKRLCEMNCPSLGFHAILDMKDTSSAGQTHSYVLVKMKGITQNKLPQFRLLWGSKPID